MLCVCGVCIPYSIFWPVLLLILKPIVDYFRSFFAIKTPTVATPRPRRDCCDDKVLKSGVYNLSPEDDWSVISKCSTLNFVRFTAEWCAPCKKIEPVFLSIGAAYPEISFISIDIDQFDEIAASYSVFSIPLVIAMRSGEIVGRLSGRDEDTLKAFVKDNVEKSKLTAIESDHNLHLD